MGFFVHLPIIYYSKEKQINRSLSQRWLVNLPYNFSIYLMLLRTQPKQHIGAHDGHLDVKIFEDRLEPGQHLTVVNHIHSAKHHGLIPHVDHN